MKLCAALISGLVLCTRAQAQNAPDISPHKTTFITTSDGNKLEVLDWGGQGPPLLFLTGWGNTAHVFDSFALKFTGKHHVYGLTRRGFGKSTHPAPTAENYDADRLANDVLDAMAALKLNRPILVGHSVAGQEMSSIGTRLPEKVTALIYLEAAYAFAYYSPRGGYTVQVEADTLRRQIQALMAADYDPQAIRTQIAKIRAALPRLDHALQREMATIDGMPQPKAGDPAEDAETAAMLTGRRMYTDIKPPILAIIAVPTKCTSDCDRPYRKAWSSEMAAQADAFQADNPKAKVVRIPQADHYIFRSNEAQVIQEMNAFMSGLSK